MINEKNATYVFVGNVANGIADEAAYTGMAAGSIAVVRALDNLNEESAISGTTPVRVVQKNADGTYKFSPIFNYSQILYKEMENFSGNVQQVSYFGYDGTNNTTGFPTIVSGDTYTLHVVLKHARNTYNNAPEIKTVPYRATSTSQADMALGLQQAFVRQFSTLREPNPVIRCERVADVASVAAFGTATTYLFTKGSTTVRTYTIGALGALTASTASVTKGQIIHAASSGGRTFTFDCADAVTHTLKIGSEAYYIADQGTAADGSDNATALAAAINASSTICKASASTATVTVTMLPDSYALPPLVVHTAASGGTIIAVTIATGDTAPVEYKVAATSNAATFELDVPWQGETGYLFEGTGTAATSTVGVATLTAGYWGLKFSGLVQPFDPINDSLTNYLVNFDITSADFGTEVEYKSQKPKYGTGTWQSVAYQEVYSKGLSRDTIRSTRPLTHITYEAKPNAAYDISNLTIRASEIVSEATGLQFNSNFRLVIATQYQPTDLDGDALKTIFAIS